MIPPENGRESIVMEIVRQVADRESISPLDLQPLSSAIDPDLIPLLPEQATLEFPYCGYIVTVEGTGTVRIRTITGE